MNRCNKEAVGEKKWKKGEEDKMKNQVKDNQWKDMEKTEKKEDDIMEENSIMCECKIKKVKGNHKEQKYGKEKKEKVKHKYALKQGGKLTKSKRGVKINDTFPQFYTLISPEEITGNLRIPLAFNPFLESASLGAISLKGPSGNIWRAKLVLDSDRLCFVNGWKEFSIDNHLESGDILVFRYDGHSQFSVLVFDTTKCEKKSALDAYPGSTLVVESETAALSIDANDTSDCYAGDNEGSNAIDTSQYDELSLCIDGTKTPKVAENDRSINGAQASQHDVPQNGSLQKFSGSSWKVKHRLFDNSFCASMDGTITGTHSDDTLENYEKVNGENNTTGHLQGNERTKASAINTANDVKQEDGEFSRNIKARWSKEPLDTFQDAGSSRLNSMKAVAKVLTEKDKENTLKRVTRLHSSCPSFLQMMLASHVWPSFFMIIPREFVRKYLPKVDAKITLWDRQGRPWVVSYVYYKSCGLGAFCRGWGAFVIGNSIEKDDICLFELFQENNIKVGVLGVQKTPCIPMLI